MLRAGMAVAMGRSASVGVRHGKLNRLLLVDSVAAALPYAKMLTEVCICMWRFAHSSLVSALFHTTNTAGCESGAWLWTLYRLEDSIQVVRDL